MDKQLAWEKMLSVMRDLLGDEVDLRKHPHFFEITFFFNSSFEDVDSAAELLTSEFNQWNFESHGNKLVISN